MTISLWIRHAEHYEQVAQQYPEVLARSVVLTADLSVSWLCQEQGRTYCSLWRFITLEDQLEAAQEALELSDTWLGDGQSMLYQGVPLHQLCRQALLYTFRDALLARRMLSSFLEREPPSALLMPPGGGVLEAVLRWTTRDRVPVSFLALADAGGRQPSPSLVNRLRRNLQGLIANQALSLHLARRRASGQPTVMFWGSGADFVNQLHVIERLRATRPYRVLHVSLNPLRASAYSRSQVVTQQPALHLLPYRDPWQYLNLRALGRQVWQWFSDRQSADCDRYPELFRNPEFAPIFRRFFQVTLSRVGGALGVAGRLMDVHKPDLVVLGNDATGREKAIIYAARQRGIPSAQLIHSGFVDLHFVARFSADQMWAWGETHRQQLAAWGAPADRVLVTGNPNYDYQVELRQSAAAIRADVRQQLGLADGELALLMITAKSPNLLTFVDLEQHTRDLRAVCEALDGFPGVRLLIKPHPRYDDRAVYCLLAQRYPWIAVIDNIMLDRLLLACDATLMVNLATTGGLEALLLGRPLIWIRPSTHYPESFSCFDPGVLVVDQCSQIAPTLEQYLQVASFRQAVADLGRRHLPNLIVHLEDGGATDAVVAAIDRLLPGGGGP